MLDDADSDAPALDPPDPERVYRNYHVTCRRLGIEPVPRQRQANRRMAPQFLTGARTDERSSSRATGWSPVVLATIDGQAYRVQTRQSLNGPIPAVRGRRENFR